MADVMLLGSDYTGSQTRLPKILLNGNNICMAGVSPPHLRALLIFCQQLIPGGEGPIAAAPDGA